MAYLDDGSSAGGKLKKKNRDSLTVYNWAFCALVCVYFHVQKAVW